MKEKLLVIGNGMDDTPMLEYLFEADTVRHDKPSGFKNDVSASRLRINGVDVYAAGRHLDNLADSSLEDIVLRDATAGIYKRLVIDRQRLVGIVLYGDTSDAAWYFDMLQRGTDISALRALLIFGQAFQESAAPNPTAVDAASPDDMPVGACHNSGMAAILRAVTPICSGKNEGTGVNAGMSHDEVRTRNQPPRRLSIPIE